MTEFVLVEIRCAVKGCGRLLDTVVGAPADEARWGGWVAVQVCQEHGDGAGRGDIRKWQERQERLGRRTDKVQTHRYIPWADLRLVVERARHTGRTQVFALPRK